MILDFTVSTFRGLNTFIKDLKTLSRESLHHRIIGLPESMATQRASHRKPASRPDPPNSEAAVGSRICAGFRSEDALGLSVLAQIVTCNHVHPLIRDTGPKVNADSVQLIAAAVAKNTMSVKDAPLHSGTNIPTTAIKADEEFIPLRRIGREGRNRQVTRSLKSASPLVQTSRAKLGRGQVLYRCQV
jgi:hypothetical protein